MNTNASTALLIATNDEARNAVGKLVRVRGMVQREKLGDTVNVGDLSVRCVDFRFPDALVGQNATAEGTLEIIRDEPATTTDAGEISQGTEDGISSLRGSRVSWIGPPNHSSTVGLRRRRAATPTSCA